MEISALRGPIHSMLHTCSCRYARLKLANLCSGEFRLDCFVAVEMLAPPMSRDHCQFRCQSVNLNNLVAMGYKRTKSMSVVTPLHKPRKSRSCSRIGYDHVLQTANLVFLFLPQTFYFIPPGAEVEMASIDVILNTSNLLQGHKNHGTNPKVSHE